MTKEERLSKYAFNAIMRQAKLMGFGELLLLKAFYQNGGAYETLPDPLKERFLAITLDITDDIACASASTVPGVRGK